MSPSCRLHPLTSLHRATEDLTHRIHRLRGPSRSRRRLATVPINGVTTCGCAFIHAYICIWTAPLFPGRSHLHPAAFSLQFAEHASCGHQMVVEDAARDVQQL